jgi:hypothetical protein
MKKSLKKQVEAELVKATEKVLSRHSRKALDKTKKNVKSGAKSLAKKFNKAFKQLEEKKANTAGRKKTSVKRGRPAGAKAAKRGRPAGKKSVISRRKSVRKAVSAPSLPKGTLTVPLVSADIPGIQHS